MVTVLRYWVRSPGSVRTSSLGICSLFLACVLVLGPTAPVAAQDAQGEETVSDLKAEFRAGISAYRSGNYETAAKRLRRVLATNSGVAIPDDDGSVSYWLGKAYAAQDRPRLARSLWSLGIKRSVERGTLDVRAADAYIRTVYRDTIQAEYEPAANVYLLLLEEGDRASLTGSEEEVIRRHVAQMRFLLPESLRGESLSEPKTPDIDRDRDGGHKLAAWWRSQDSEPASPRNERLVEHLRRVEHAQNQYGYKGSPTGFDDRGRIYVRLGEPTLERSVDFHSRELLEVLRRIDTSTGNNLYVSLSTFADNEFWVYERGEEPYPYLFVDDGNSYRIGGVTDLVPAHIATALTGQTGRGGAKADVVLEAMRTAYRQLATYHMGYGSGFNRLDGYLNAMEGARIRHRARANGMVNTRSNRGDNGALIQHGGQAGGNVNSRSRRSDNSALIQEDGAPSGVNEVPTQKAHDAVSHAKREAAQMAQEREENVPRQETQTLDDVATLPVGIRVARFLEEDGTTSTRVYWGLAERDLENTPEGMLTSGPRLIRLSVRQMKPDYRVRRYDAKRYLVKPFEKEGDLIVADDQVEVGGDTAMYHLGLQWNHYTVNADDNEIPAEEDLLRTGIAKVDSMRALTSDEAELEMSDLVPAVHRTGEGVPELKRGLTHPYPFAQISDETPLALYFELYHLKKDDEGTVKYSIEYEIHRQTDRGQLERLFRGTDERTTSVSTTREGRARTAQEYIVLDLDDWEMKADKELKVTVRVTDENSDQHIERSAEFRVVSPDKH